MCNWHWRHSKSATRSASNTDPAGSSVMALRLWQIGENDAPNEFPPTDHALQHPNGLLAVGGDLSPDRLIHAYSRGIFPWYSEDEPILWWSPDPRTVFIPGQVHVARRLARRMRSEDYAVTLDRAFADVVTACSAPREKQIGTWLLPEMQSAYKALHARGFAHSIEVWQQGQLVGGLYGVALGHVFFGESMFSRASDMSKIALVTLSQLLRDWGYLMLDGQVASPHLERMGAVQLDRGDFEALLRRAIPTTPIPGPWPETVSLPQPEAHLPQFEE